MSANNIFKACVVVLLTLLLAYILVSSWRILIVLTIAFIIACAVRPIVQTMVSWRIPEGLAIVLTYLFLIGIAVLVSIVIFPPIISQLISYIENDDRLANRIIGAQDFFQSMIRDVTNNNVSLIAPDDIRTNVASIVEQIRAATPEVLNNAGGIAGDIILIFVIGVYWLTSREKTINFAQQLSPSQYKSRVDDVIKEIESTMGSYVRGVVTIASIVTFLNFVPMFFLGVPNALLIAVVIGLSTTIPMVGGLIGGITAVVLTMLISPYHALIALVIFLVVQQIENNILQPRIMSDRVGLDPLLVIVYTSIGLVVGGIVGALLAVPVMATIHVILKYFVLEPYVEEVSEFETENGIPIIKNRAKPEPTEVLLVREPELKPKTNGE